MTRRSLTPEIFTADYQGEAGARAFFVQLREGDEVVTFAAEKQQVRVLAEKLSEVLLIVDKEDPVARTEPARDPALMMTPIEPEHRIGSIGIAYEEEGDAVVIAIEPLTEGEEEPPDPGEGPDGIRAVLRRDQIRSFVLHALAVVAEGRPVCQLCGLPMDPAGHACPSSNGHHPPA